MKKLIMVMALSFCVIAISACSSGSATSTGDSQASADTTKGQAQVIDEEKAKSIALKHAKLSENEVQFSLVHLDMDDGIETYDIEFYTDGKEYDYEIDPYSGEIISYDYEMESKVPQQAQQAQQTQPANDAQKSENVTAKISLEKAKEIALKKAGLSAKDVTFTESQYEIDDGYELYQIDFISGDMEYEIEIDANTGNILEYDCESVYD